MNLFQVLLILLSLLVLIEANPTTKKSCDTCFSGVLTTNLSDGNSKIVPMKMESEVDYSEQHQQNKEYAATKDNEDNGTCPLWFTYDNSTSNNNSCQCGAELGGVIRCKQKQRKVYLRGCHCMSSFKLGSREIAVVGRCFYTCIQDTTDTKQCKYDEPYCIEIPYSISELDELCSPTNRQGLLCGECKEGFFPPLYSYEHKCVNCTNTNIYYNLAKYFLIAIAPLTAFLIAVICFRISATSPQLNAFVFVSQVMAATPSVAALLPQVEAASAAVGILAKVGFFFYGMWYMDLFRGLFSPICLSITTRQALAMDYIVAFYPLVVLGVTYILIELHARNCRVIVWLWKPFHRCFIRFKAEWNVRTSVIDAFATFLLLSYSKVLLVSVTLVIPVMLFDVSGNTVGGLYSPFDGSVNLVNGTQIYVSVFVLLLLVFFSMLPALFLVLYPFSCFQRCLNCCCLQRHALQAFADAFQGCYKDGTNGDPDRRWFAAVYLFARIAVLLVYTFTIGNYFFPVSTIVLLILVIVVIIVQPYKQQYAIYNRIDAVLITVLSLWYVSIQGVITASKGAPQFLDSSLFFAALLFFCPLVYITSVFLYWFFCRAKFPQRLLNRCQLWRRVTARWRRESDADLLPDRIINPWNYGAVLQHAALADDSEEENDATI